MGAGGVIVSDRVADLAVSANNFMRSGLQAAYKVPLVKKMH